jgi:hypothetical protein
MPAKPDIGEEASMSINTLQRTRFGSSWFQKPSIPRR